MAVDVTALLCPLNVRTGVVRTAVGPEAFAGRVGSSAERMEREKSRLAVSSARDDGKNLSAVTELRCALLVVQTEGLEGAVGTMYIKPSSYPAANWEPSGATSKTAIFRR